MEIESGLIGSESLKIKFCNISFMHLAKGPPIIKQQKI